MLPQTLRFVKYITSMEAMMRRILARFWESRPKNQFEILAGQCESPAEKRFLLAAYRSLAEYGRLSSQDQIGPYRVDFLLLVSQRVKVVFEIDGQDYHSSPAQRNHDSQRDRWLMRQGYQVIRFTGSQVYNDSAGCAREAVELVRGYKSLLNGR